MPRRPCPWNAIVTATSPEITDALTVAIVRRRKSSCLRDNASCVIPNDWKTNIRHIKRVSGCSLGCS